MSNQSLVLLDNSVIDTICSNGITDRFQYAITARTNHVNSEYREKYPELIVVPNVARLDHSFFDAGEVYGDENSVEISNKLLSIAASQQKITEVGRQTNFNQRDDADIIVAGYINSCEYLVSDDKKFMLNNEVRDFMKGFNLTIVSSKEFIDIMKTTL